MMKLTDKIDSILKQKSGEVWSVSPDQSVYEYRRRDGSEYFKPVGYSVAKSGMLNFTRWLAEYCAQG